MRYLLKYKLLGGHVHAQVFESATANWEKNGDLVFDEKSFLQFKHLLADNPYHPVIETVGEDGWNRMEIR